MLEKIVKLKEDHTAIIKELESVMGRCDNSPFNLDFINKKWRIDGDELILQVDNKDLKDDCYNCTISSEGAEGKKLFMGEDGDYFYVMAHDGNWDDTQIFVLDNKFKELNKSESTGVLNEYGKQVWKHKTNKRLFLEKSYGWVNNLVLIDETEGRQIIMSFNANDFDDNAWEPMTKKEFDSVVSRYKEIYE